MTTFIPITFRVKAYTQPGEKVYVIGNIRSLGNNKIEKAIPLVTSPDEYPYWYSSSPILVHSNTTVKYRYLIYSGGLFNRYEDGDERTIIISNTNQPSIDDRFVDSSTNSPDISPSVSRINSISNDESPRILDHATIFQKTPNLVDDHSNTPNSFGKASESYSPAKVGTPESILRSVTPKTASMRRIHWLRKRMSEEDSKSNASTNEEMSHPRSFVRKRSSQFNTLSKRYISDKGSHLSQYSPATTVATPKEDMLSSGSSSDDEGNGANVDDNNDDVKITSRSSILLTSYFLPVTLKRETITTPQGSIQVKWNAQWDPNEFLSPKHYVDRSGNKAIKGFGNVNSDIPAITCIGFPRTEEPIPVEEQDLVTEALAKLQCVPVFLDENLHRQAYFGYAIGTLYEIFHGVIDVLGEKPTRWWNRSTQEQTWRAFSMMNHQFARTLVETCNQGDIVWIHGIELILLPSLAARKLMVNHPKIGYFLHSPFPSSEIFRTLSVREDLLRGMLGADQIGFHAFDHVRQFTTCCKRILGLSTEPSGKGGAGALNVIYQGRHVNISACHAGIDPNFLQHRLARPEILKAAIEIRQRAFPDTPPQSDEKRIVYDSSRILISCIDDSNRLQGAFFQLLAFEKFLTENPEYKNMVHFIQYTTLLPYTSSASQKVIDDCQLVANRINEKFPGTILFELKKQPIGIDERLALWTSSDILFRTPIREGVCLYPFEFLLAASSFHRVPLMILSDFSADCKDLIGSFRANPMRMDEMVQSLIQCLTVSPDEAKARCMKDISFVNHHTLQEWAKHMLKDILKAHAFNRSEGKELSYTGIGLGLGFRSIGFRPNFKRMNEEEVIKAYKASSNRLFLLDYGGTTVRDDPIPVITTATAPVASNPSCANAGPPFITTNTKTKPKMPSSALIRSFEILCADPRNTVFIVSGREKEELEEVFGKAPVLSLIAEHGFSYSWGSGTPYGKGREKDSYGMGDDLFPLDVKEASKKKVLAKREWEMLGDHFDESWKDLVQSIMRVYTARTSGTYIEHKGNTLLWQYRDADPEFGKMQAQELRDHLDGVLKTFPVSVELGKTYVEVRPDGCDKGTASFHVIQNLEVAGIAPDFILSMGDDVADERMFKKLEEISPRLQEIVSEQKMGKCNKDPVKMFTCTIGKKPSEARYFLDDVDDVENLLGALAKNSMKDSRSQSLLDLRVFDMYLGSAAPPDVIEEEEEMEEEEYGTFDPIKNRHSLNVQPHHTVKFTLPSPPKEKDYNKKLKKFESSEVQELKRRTSRENSPRAGGEMFSNLASISTSSGKGMRMSKSMPFLQAAVMNTPESIMGFGDKYGEEDEDDMDEKIILSQDEGLVAEDTESATTEISSPTKTLKTIPSSRNLAEYLANVEDGDAPGF